MITSRKILILTNSSAFSDKLSAQLVAAGMTVSVRPLNSPDREELSAEVALMEGDPASLEVFKDFRKHGMLPQLIPFIFIGTADAQERAAFFINGARDYVSIPFDIKELAVRIEIHHMAYESCREMSRQNAMLEKRAAQRTHELAKANDSLMQQIYEQQELQKELHDAKDFSESIITSSIDGIFSFDKEYRLTYWNPEMEVITGFSRETCIRKSVLELFPFLENIDEKSIFKRVLSGEKVIAMTRPYQIPEKGKGGWFSGRYSPLCDKSGTIVGGVAVIRDVTEQRRVEEELEDYRKKLESLVKERTADLNESQRALNTLLSNLPGLIAYRIKPDDKWTMEFISEGCSKLTGHPSTAFLGNKHISYGDLIHPDDRKQVLGEMQQGLLGHSVFEMTYRILDKEQATRWVWEKGQGVYNDNNQLMAIEGLITDISKQKATESMLEEARKQADSANQAKSTFLANMSHEIRTPLNAIIGFTDILKQREVDKVKANYIDTIHSSGQALLGLINDILDLSKIEAGMLDLQFSSVSFEDIFFDMKNIFSQKIKAKDLDLRMEIGPTLPQALILDETRIRQILINLMGNAIKFTSEGYIHVSAHANSAKGEFSRVDLILEVEDTGQGIPADQAGSIFEPFKQIEGQKVSRFGGTGLGLSICKRITELMGGEISVRSQVNHGSSFRVTIRNVEVGVAIEATSGSPRVDIQFSPATILIADDIDFNRELLGAYLENWDFDLLYAKDGREAWEMIQKHHPDLVLLDMKMPEMSGYDVAEHVRNDDTLMNTPIIAVTASAFKRDYETIDRLCDSYLRKPVICADLIKEVTQYLEHTEQVLPVTDDKTINDQPLCRGLKDIPQESLLIIRDAARVADLSKLENEIDKYSHVAPGACQSLLEISTMFDYEQIIKLCEDALD